MNGDDQHILWDSSYGDQIIVSATSINNSTFETIYLITQSRVCGTRLIPLTISHGKNQFGSITETTPPVSISGLINAADSQ